MKICRLILTAGIMFYILCITAAAGFEYGRNNNFPDLERFSGQAYVIYKNAYTQKIELATVVPNDIKNMVLIAEDSKQIDVPSINEVGTDSGLDFGPGTGTDISLSDGTKLYLNDQCSVCKWYLEYDQWIQLTEAEESSIICKNYDDLIYSGIPVIEKISKKKTGRPYYRAYSSRYFVDYDRVEVTKEDGSSKYMYNILFSDNGIDVKKSVYVPQLNNGGIGGVYSGNGKTILMGIPDMALSEFQRPAGFSSGCIYIFDENCDLVQTISANGLQSCKGFYNGYFYFVSAIYKEKGKAEIIYSKSEDGTNSTEITKMEFDNAIDNINKQTSRTVFGNYMSFATDDNKAEHIYSYKNSDEHKKEIVYESDIKLNCNDILMDSQLSGNIVRSEWMAATLNSKGRYITVDYIYRLPLLEIDNSKTPYHISEALWATDDYVYIDQDIEYIFRIPVSQFKSQIYVEFNNKILAFDQPPIIEDDRTLVPMRFLFEQMGADVDWNGEVQAATATLNDTAVTFAINETEAKVNNTPVSMDVPARLINGKTMVPLRFLSENLGYTVTWDEETRTAIIE